VVFFLLSLSVGGVLFSVFLSSSRNGLILFIPQCFRTRLRRQNAYHRQESCDKRDGSFTSTTKGTYRERDPGDEGIATP
jgi:hypothetical protein